MPSTYTTNNGIEKIATGEQSGTWGDTTNTNFDLLDTSLDGQVSVALGSTGSTGSPNTLAVTDGSTSNGRNRFVEFTGTPGGDTYVQLTPADSEKVIHIQNSTNQTLFLFQGTYDAGRDYQLPAGRNAVIRFTGAGASASYAYNALEDLEAGSFNSGVLQAKHDGTNAIISNETGDLKLQNNEADKDILIQTDDGSGGRATYIMADGSTGATKLSFAASGSSSTKLATTNTGVDITGGFAATDGSTITTADNSDQLTLISTDTDASAGPNFVLFRNPGEAGADSDVLGTIKFEGLNDAGSPETINYSQIISSIVDASDGTEDGLLKIETVLAGTSRDRMTMNSTETIFNDGSQDLDFRVESDNDANALVVEGSSGHIGLGTNNPGCPLHIINDTLTDFVRFESSEQGTPGDHAPELSLYRNLSSPADGDAGGSVEYNFNDSAGNNTTFARIKSVANDVTNGTEDGAIFFEVRTAGSLNEKMRIDQGGVGVGGVTAETGIDLQVQGTTKISKTNNDSALILESTDGDADDGPILLSDRVSGSPANNDNLGKTIYRGRNDAAQEVDYVTIRAEARTVADGGEDGRFQMSVIKDGTSVNVLDVDMDGGSNEIVFNDGAADVNFRVEGAANTNMIFMDAGDDSLGIGSNSQKAGTAPRMYVHNDSTGATLEIFRDTSTGSAGLTNWYSNVGGADTVNAQCEANGDFENTNNSYTGLSDQRLKQDIVDATSQWADIKALQVRKYRFINHVNTMGDDATVQLGVIAQELEASGMNGLVKTKPVDEADPDGPDRKSVRYSVLYMKAVKALQEAMVRIETLETKVAALEAG